MRRAPVLLFLALAACMAPGAARAQSGFPPLPTAKPPALPPVAAGPQPGQPGKGAAAGRQVGSGTGFVVAPRRVMTNHHVVERCRAVQLRGTGGGDLSARVLASDAQRDLALLEVQGEPGPPLTFRRDANIRRGEGVVTYGFPLAGLLSSGPTLTTGEISALAGLADNQRQFQISAPVQPGNSGGPLLDMGGRVVGVIVSKLNAQRVAQQTGDIPQNVNFAVKGAEAQEFLRLHGVTPILADGRPDRNAAEVGETAHPSVVLVRCLG